MKRGDITLIMTGGLRMPEDFAKALGLAADGVAISNSAMQTIGWTAARMCNSNQCPAGLATQDPELRGRLDVQAASERLARFFSALVDLMSVLARACGHDSLGGFRREDMTTWKREMADLRGTRSAGFDGSRVE
jgi:glutamate synthase domain-containing protein 2